MDQHKIHSQHTNSDSNIFPFSINDVGSIHESIQRIFSSKDGEKILEYWQKSILERSLSYDTSVKQMYYLAGERNFILKLKRVVNNEKQQFTE